MRLLKLKTPLLALVLTVAGLLMVGAGYLLIKLLGNISSWGMILSGWYFLLTDLCAPAEWVACLFSKATPKYYENLFWPFLLLQWYLIYFTCVKTWRHYSCREWLLRYQTWVCGICFGIFTGYIFFNHAHFSWWLPGAGLPAVAGALWLRGRKNTNIVWRRFFACLFLVSVPGAVGFVTDWRENDFESEWVGMLIYLALIVLWSVTIFCAWSLIAFLAANILTEETPSKPGSKTNE